MLENEKAFYILHDIDKSRKGKNMDKIDDQEKLTKQEEIEKADNNKTNSHDEYERYCYLCRRSEKQAGKMISMPGNMNICSDCMQKTLDSMNSGQFRFFDMNSADFSKMDFSKIFGMQQPKSQKVKKKKEEKKEEPVFSLKNIPAPHKIKGMLDDFVIG